MSYTTATLVLPDRAGDVQEIFETEAYAGGFIPVGTAQRLTDNGRTRIEGDVRVCQEEQGR